jgi:chemotaxis protein CheD
MHRLKTPAQSLTAKQISAVHQIIAGEHFSSVEPIIIGTLLGSCVAACIWDPHLKIGGMNHFMLPIAPGSQVSAGAPARYGLYAMEVLINDLLRKGCNKSRLEFKVFGGANITGTETEDHIGARNARFVLDFLEQDGFKPLVADLGGDYGRRIYFNIADGQVRRTKIAAQAESRLIKEEVRYGRQLTQAPPAGDLTFF